MCSTSRRRTVSLYPKRQPPSAIPATARSPLCAAIVKQGIAIEVTADLDGAHGVSLGGRIKILSGLSHAEEFVVLVHEYGHELRHRSANRPTSRDQRELEAKPSRSWSVKPSVSRLPMQPVTTSTSTAAIVTPCWPRWNESAARP